MAAATPVISSNTGGLPEVNIHGKTGYLTDVGDVETMASFAVSLLSDKEKLTAFKQQAYAHASLYDVDKIVPQYEALYQQIVH